MSVNQEDTSIGGVLLDLSGVLYVGEQALPGAVDAVRRLRLSGLPLRFLTNVTRTPTVSLLERLRGLGFALDEGELFTAPVAAREYLLAQRLQPYLLVHPDLRSEFAALSREPYNAVLVGDAGEGFSYGNMNSAFRLLMEGAPLLAMGNNRYFRAEGGFFLDIGPYVTALEYATGTSALVLGKPARAFFDEAVASLGCETQRAVMIGDDALADVEGALLAGLQGILVQTGKYRPGDEAAIGTGGARVFADISSAVAWILGER
jgi:HAD superfamily hydrolase (TIGR01458 family)